MFFKEMFVICGYLSRELTNNHFDIILRKFTVAVVSSKDFYFVYSVSRCQVYPQPRRFLHVGVSIVAKEAIDGLRPRTIVKGRTQGHRF